MPQMTRLNYGMELTMAAEQWVIISLRNTYVLQSTLLTQLTTQPG